MTALFQFVRNRRVWSVPTHTHLFDHFWIQRFAGEIASCSSTFHLRRSSLISVRHAVGRAQKLVMEQLTRASNYPAELNSADPIRVPLSLRSRVRRSRAEKVRRIPAEDRYERLTPSGSRPSHTSSHVLMG